MKIALWLSFFTFLFFFSCAEKENLDKKDLEVKTKEIEKLKKQLQLQTESQIHLNNLIISLTSNYMSIDSSLKVLKQIGKDPTKRQVFNEKAEEVESFFLASQNAIDSVESKLISMGSDRTQSLVALEAIKVYLNYQKDLFIEVFSAISSYSGKLLNLKSNLGSTQKSLAESKEEIAARELKLEQSTKASNRVYYITGEKEELLRAKVATKVKSALGLKYSIKLSDKLDPGHFLEADLNQLLEIDLGNGKNPILLTNHPKDSYIIQKSSGEAYLRITNPNKFWNSTRFLVIQKD